MSLRLPLLAGLSLFACAAAVQGQAPQPRLQAFDGALRDHEPILETESMIASASSRYNDAWNVGAEQWDKVRFWDLDGSNYSERTLPAGSSAMKYGMYCMAQGSDLFLGNGYDFRVVNRNPDVPIRWLTGFSNQSLMAINDRFFIIRTTYAQDWDGIIFRDRNSYQKLGRVPTTLRVQQMAARENEIVFVSRDGKGGYHLHRMGYPDFSRSDVVKMKITNLPGTYSWVRHFGKDFAVMTQTGKDVLIRWEDPNKGGKLGIYPIKEPPNWTSWVETSGRIAQWTSYPELKVDYLEFGAKGGYALKPLGVPAGILQANVLSAGANSVYFGGPSSFENMITTYPWVQRLDVSPGRHLQVSPAVADERDGVMRFTLKLDRPAAQAISFSFSTLGRTAVAGSDFTAQVGIGAVFAPGQSQFVVDVPLLEDQAIEKPETLELRITDLNGAYCDKPVAVGLIRGSGARLLEEVVDDDGAVSDGLHAFIGPVGAQRRFVLPGGTADARELGYECFWPLPDNGDLYRYARALVSGTGERRICQFDPATAQLLESFPDAACKVGGGTLTLGHGQGYRRYGFYDGFPVLSLDGITVPENGGTQEITVRSERTSQELGFSASWAVPADAAGAIAFAKKPSGDIALTITPEDNAVADSGLPLGITTTISPQGGGTGSTMISKLLIEDDDVVQAQYVATQTLHADSLAAGGKRLWLAGTNGSSIESFNFSGGALKAGVKAALPKNVRLHSNYGSVFYGSGQILSYDDDRLLVSADTALQGGGVLVVSGAGGNKPKGKFVVTQELGSAQLAVPGYTITSNTYPGFAGPEVQVRDLKNKLLKELVSGAGTAFGYALAVSNNTLWISSPLAGRVDGYRLSDFELVATLESPDPVEGGAFGYSMAAHGGYLVIGEPSEETPGAAWVFSADGGTLLKRLGSGAVSGRDGFGFQVATRSGRILIGAGGLESVFAGNATGYPGHRPVLLWNSLNADPVRVLPSTRNVPGQVSGYRIALLDDCAVFATRNESSGGLEYYPFPGASAPALAAKVKAAGAVVPVWPAEGAAEPEWEIVRGENGGIQVMVDFGATFRGGDGMILERSQDLVLWAPLADAAGQALAPQVKSVEVGETGIRVALDAASADRGFFRMRMRE